ncbi:hypothetical protein Poli38472_005690 [Pythium oligandrum]|uniref:GPI ethanolamine phosphate transferase 3 n=1 Tax=Pythium oligandrum TaxID=41045 RepID=A0A8K1CJ07_PYTOL|nr:hypothetical protein Poli38472_005690 [Pythium oligandrum]|eukprot:TMW63072.1 hypothetical protein Poli38472_005690 [Pythium oligandrum]
MPTTRQWRGGMRALLWILIVHAAALYLFTTGFFLTRFEVPDVSECESPPHAPAANAHLRHHDASGVTVESESCWMPRRFRRVVFVVIDALRFDFVASPSDDPSSFYLNHLPVLNATLETQPTHSALFKFVADPPTMTMQRLKGLTTGSLPTFLDIKDNMASSEITEDNLIRQMHQQQRPIVFMGDDTWDSLYEKYFTRKYSFDSFNVKDLHTVDQGVIRHLFPELKESDWGLLIAHFLGVDHVGHTHGPSSVYMTDKLKEMNSVLTRLLGELPDDDTLLLIMGDHGMSADGNHGGASDEETGAALFLYSKQPLVSSAAMDNWSREVPQVDLVPTIALLTGIPIPFGNLGAVIPQLFYHQSANEDSESEAGQSFKTLNKALRLNVDQVRRYLLTYSSASKLPASEYEHLERLFQDISTLQQQVDDLGCAAEDVRAKRRCEELSSKQHAYLREALALGRSIWTQFDFHSMIWGTLLLLIGLVLVAWTLITFESTASDTHGFPWRGALIGVLTSIITPGLSVLPRQLPSKVLAVGVLVGCLEVMWTKLHSKSNPTALKYQVTSSKWWSWMSSSAIVAFVTVLLHVLALLSNSYIVAEDKVMQFLAVTVGFFVLWYSNRYAKPDLKRRGVASAMILILASRVAGAMTPPNIIQSTTSVTRTWLPLVVMCLGGVVFSLWECREARIRSVVQAVLIVTCYAAAGAYWWLAPISSAFWRLWLPRLVFVVLLSQLTFRLRRGIAQSFRPVDQSGFKKDFFSVLPLLVLAYSLVLGPTSPLTTLCVLAQSFSLADAAFACFSTRDVPISWVFLCCSLSYHAFFVTGHQNTFTSLQNAAGFVGFDEFNFYWAGALLGFNTFGSYVLGLMALPMLWWRPSSSTKSLGFHTTWWRAAFAVIGYFGLNALVSTIFVALQRRHLMVWAIFAPKFIFDGATLLVVEVLTVFVALQVAGNTS